MTRTSLLCAAAAVFVVAGLSGLSPRSTATAQGEQPAPTYQVDATWPKPLPNRWLVGAIAGVAVDARNHVWIVHRPGTLQPNETRSIWRAAPPVLEFDQEGNLVSSWGGPGAGYEWPDLEHGIYVDHQDHVWLEGGGEKDAQLLKFTRQGAFLMQITVVVLLLAGLGALPARASAQEGATVARGTRVRVWTFEPSAPPILGEFERWTGIGLLVYEGETARTIAFDDIDILEVSEGRSFNTTGAIIGGVLGAAAGGALACATVNRDDYGVFCGGQSDTEIFVGAALGAAAGVALGGLVFRVERWMPVPLLGLLGLR